jgi:tyrosyl-tRNA synthetase
MKSIVKLLSDEGMVMSMAEARRAVTMKIVKVNGEVVEGIDSEIEAPEGTRLQIGKREKTI